MQNLANILTFSRIGIIPLVIGGFYMQSPIGDWIAAIVYIVACITDFLDGYVARHWGQTSKLGQFLDPVADKLLVASTLLMLVGFDRIQGISLLPTVVILCREILVSEWRDHLTSLKSELPVSSLSKWKTGIQMTAIALLMVGGPRGIHPALHIGGILGLWGAAFLTLITGYDYIKKGAIDYDPHLSA